MSINKTRFQKSSIIGEWKFGRFYLPARTKKINIELKKCACVWRVWINKTEKQVRQLCLQFRNWVRPIVVARMGDFNKGWKREEYGLPKLGFPHSSVSKESEYNAGDLGSIPGLERPPVEGNDNPLQYSCLENPMDTRAWQATVHGVARVGHNLVTKSPPV